MSKRVKNSLLYLLPSVVGAVLPLIVLPIFTRIIPVKDYGALALCQGYAIFITGVSNFGLTFGYERNFFESNEVKKQAGLLYTTMLFVSFTSLLFIVLTYILSSEISFFLIGDKKYNSLLNITYVATTITGLKTYFLTYYKNTENAKKYVLYTLDENLLSFLFSIALVVYFDFGVLGIVIAQLIASVLVFTLLCYRFLNMLSFCIDIEAFKKSLQISIPLTPRIFFGVIGAQFDKYIIGRMTSIGSVGVFSIAQRLSSIVFVFMTAIQNVWGPIVYKLMFSNEKDSNKKIANFLSPFFYLSTLMGLLISIFSEEIIYIIAPKEYESAAELITILSILQTSLFFGKQNQLIFAKKTMLISTLTLIGIALNIVMNLVFIKMWGTVGVALGTLLSGLIIGAISFHYSQKSFKIEWDKYKYTLVFLLYIIASVTVLMLIYFEVNYIVKLIVKIFFLAMFIFLGYKIDILTKSRYLAIKSLVTSKIQKSE